jgi:hypothetical protein
MAKRGKEFIMEYILRGIKERGRLVVKTNEPKTPNPIQKAIGILMNIERKKIVKNINNILNLLLFY